MLIFLKILQSVDSANERVSLKHYANAIFFNALLQRWNSFYEIWGSHSGDRRLLYFGGSTSCSLVVSTNVREEPATTIFGVEENIRIDVSL
jgi:hypothetical protein